VADAEKKLMLEDEIMDSVGDKDGATVVAVPNAANFTKVAA
jgi:hypothetical protein